MSAEELLGMIVDEPSEDIYRQASERFDSLAKPLDGFGAFEDMICRIASMQRRVIPDISKKALVIMIADNGVTDEGVTQTDRSVTEAVARLMGKCESTVGIQTSGYPLSVIPVDVGIDSDEAIPGVVDKKVARGSGNIAKTAAMSEKECLAAILAGIDTVRACAKCGMGMIATGEMGIGNTTTSTALLCALCGMPPKDVTGRGAGLSDEGLFRKINVIEDALRLHGFWGDVPSCIDARYALSALATVGGFDIAGLAGVFIGCAENHIPAVIDGAISAVAALTAHYILPGCERYMLASHKGKENVSKRALDILGLRPVIDADLAIGEGTGAVMLFPLLDMVMSVYSGGTAFDDAGIGRYERFDI